jgi:membrane fusion protein, multidrug efflux system
MAAAFAALIAIVYRGIHFWNYFQSYESSNDAQIDAPVSPISSRITGTITRVYIEDYQRVKPGQLLVKLDPREHQVAVERARAQLAQAEAEVNSGPQKYALVLAEIREAQARDVVARRTEQRYSALLRLDVISQAQYHSYKAIAGAQSADVRADQADTAVAFDDIAARQAEVHPWIWKGVKSDGVMAEAPSYL